MKPLEIGVCQWSIDRHDPRAGLEVVRSAINLRAAQIGFFGAEALHHVNTNALRETIRDTDIEVPAVFVGFDGVDRSSIESVAATSGLVPDGEFMQRMSHIKRAGEIASAIDAHFVVAHWGAVPADAADDRYSVLLARVRQTADALIPLDVALLAETGQESAEVLARFLTDLDRPNVGVNYDPANFVLAGTGDPVKAVTVLAGHVKQVHLKDATASSAPGVEWGRTVSAGTGDADLPRVVSKLRARGYTGPLFIETKSEGDAVAAVAQDVEFVRSMLEV